MTWRTLRSRLVVGSMSLMTVYGLGPQVVAAAPVQADIQLVSVQFDFDPQKATEDAFSIRQARGMAPLILPEWRLGESNVPDASPAAYALNALSNGQADIQAEFRCLNGEELPTEGVDVEIRAQDVGNVRPLLPGTEATRVHIPQHGKTGFVRFKLADPQFKQFGVGKYIVKWMWQQKAVEKTDDVTNWKELNAENQTTSQHCIYIVLNLPTSPWQPTRNGGQQKPLIGALEQACQWARGASNEDQAAYLVTQRLYDYGRSGKIHYDSTTSSSYTSLVDEQKPDGDRQFDCTSFLSDLADDTTLLKVNCFDCAAIVCSFSNLLGCDLSEAYLDTKGATATGNNHFLLNPVRLIGTRDWNNPACPEIVTFGDHMVAWKGSLTDGHVYDAMVEMEVPSTASPWLPFTRLVPANLPFSVYSSGLLRPVETARFGPRRLQRWQIK